MKKTITLLLALLSLSIFAVEEEVEIVQGPEGKKFLISYSGKKAIELNKALKGKKSEVVDKTINVGENMMCMAELSGSTVCLMVFSKDGKALPIMEQDL